MARHAPPGPRPKTAPRSQGSCPRRSRRPFSRTLRERIRLHQGHLSGLVAGVDRVPLLGCQHLALLDRLVGRVCKGRNKRRILRTPPPAPLPPGPQRRQRRRSDRSCLPTRPSPPMDSSRWRSIRGADRWRLGEAQLSWPGSRRTPCAYLTCRPAELSWKSTAIQRSAVSRSPPARASVQLQRLTFAPSGGAFDRSSSACRYWSAAGSFSSLGRSLENEACAPWVAGSPRESASMASAKAETAALQRASEPGGA